MEGAKPRPKRRISKKRKSAWRKHVLVKEVGEYFQDKRIEERLGSFANDQDIQNLFSTNQEEIKETASKRRKISKDVIMKSHFPPSLDDHIKPIRHPAPNKPKATVAKPKLTLPIKVKIEEEEEDDDKDRNSKTNFFDIWGAPKSASNPTNDFTEHGKRVCKEIRVKPPPHFGKKPNENRAIPIPLPGTSYNPSSDDHEDLIMKAFEVEEEKEKKELKIVNATDRMFPLRNQAPTLETWLDEMSAGQFIPGLVADKEDEEEEEEDEDEGVIKVSHNPPVRREDKKTEKERKKMKERKLEEKRLKMEKEKKLKEAEKFKINTAKKKIRQEEMKQAIRQSWRRFEAEKRKNLPKKLGRTRFQEPDIDLKLSDEISDSLRNLKPEGHILRDLVSSIQRRSMAPAVAKGEPKKRQRRYKKKVFEKPSHKAITI